MTESSFRRLLLRFALVPVLGLCLLLSVLGIQIHQISLIRAQDSEATATLLQCDRLLQSMIDEETASANSSSPLEIPCSPPTLPGGFRPLQWRAVHPLVADLEKSLSLQESRVNCQHLW